MPLMAGRAGWVRASGARTLLLGAVIVAGSGCAIVTTAIRGEPDGVVVRSDTVLLHGSPLALHLAQPVSSRGRPLVLYASGDGGWFGTAIDMFRVIAAQGYPTVGFSARAFLRIERPRHAALNPRQLALDYETILTHARAALDTPPGTRAILTGWSRGASFAALAGTEPVLRAHTAGIVAIGLAADENLTIDAENDGDDGPGDAPSGPLGAFAPYALLQRPGAPPTAVIQAEHDNYLRAAAARTLLGPDTTTRRLYPVAARDHRFSGGEAEFTAALEDALAWLGTPARDAPLTRVLPSSS